MDADLEKRKAQDNRDNIALLIGFCCGLMSLIFLVLFFNQEWGDTRIVGGLLFISVFFSVTFGCLKVMNRSAKK